MFCKTNYLYFLNRFRLRNSHVSISIVVLFVLVFSGACERKIFERQTIAPKTLRDVSSSRLNFSYEADVPAPSVVTVAQDSDELAPNIVAHFSEFRKDDVIEKTIVSPDKQRIVVVYHKPEDSPSEFRLDIHSAEGQLINKITPDSLAANFPDTIMWSPDSNYVAFVGTTRTIIPEVKPVTAPSPPDIEANVNSTSTSPVEDANANSNIALPTPTATPTMVLTFRTEQIYLCDREGLEIKPLTQEEGKIYFYFTWSPDSSVIAALATSWREWRVAQSEADRRGEIFVPEGRPRLIEKNGRIRRLDDGVTSVQPAWSPDSSKVAFSFGKEIRIYDAIGDSPSQAGIPLRNQLLISSSAYEEQKRKELSNISNGDANANTIAESNTQTASTASALPDENSLVSFNPVVRIEWTAPEMLYFETAYVRLLKDESKTVKSFPRWHRLILSAQPIQIN